jgi:hypothetical protein
MGVFFSKPAYDFTVAVKENRLVYVRNVEQIASPSILFSGHYAYRIEIFYLRYRVEILKKFNQITAFEKLLSSSNFYMRNRIDTNIRNLIPKIPRPRCFTRFTSEEQKLIIAYYLQHVCDSAELMSTPLVKSFFGLSSRHPLPELGRVGLEGFVRKSSGGYIKKFSTKLGESLSSLH